MVEVDGWDRQVPACSQPVMEGMVVETESSPVVAARRFVLELLLRNYVDADGREGEENEFLRWVRHYDVQLRDGINPLARYPVDADPNPFVRVDLNKCILCTRCVRVCEEVQVRDVWGVGNRGHDARIIAGLDSTMLDARCESCGACAAYCPTGALSDKPSYEQPKPNRLVTTTCTYCGVGCQFDLNLKDDKVVRVTSNPDAAVNGMSLCVKGRYGYGFIHHADRLTQPLVRRYLLDGKPKPASIDARGDWVPVEWDTALDLVAGKFTQIKQESGPDAFGVLTSAKCTNEENYLMQKFARQILGTNNVDHCARL
jgi:predicted molibdopterin-dependent oxidoreductase YjgC